MIKAFGMDESGQGILEYALILAFVAVVAVTALQFLATKPRNSLNNAAGALD